MQKLNDIGVIGLGVMGKNIALNMSDHGYRVSVFNRTYKTTEEVLSEHSVLYGYEYLEDFVNSLVKPRKILLMVKAGKPIDATIESLLPFLDKEDIIMDGGNSNFKDTIKREAYLSSKNLRYLGVGISGGEEGARFGPSIMPAGTKEAYREAEQIFIDISAKYQEEPCVTYIGEDGSGHYVKTIHNGIEYGDMQLISEAYYILKKIGNFSNDEMANIFKTYNEGKLESYLVEITSEILATKDELTENYLIDIILDKASQKGTGAWTVISSIEEGVDTSVITSAVYNRIISSKKDERIIANKAYEDITLNSNVDTKDLVHIVENSLYFAKIMSYAQGFDLLKTAGVKNNWSLNFEEISKIWRGGCIIRAAFLDDISNAYHENPELPNLILDNFFKQEILNTHQDVRKLISYAIENGIAVSGFTSALAYFDAYRDEFNPANLIQAQRDYFGAHTFERTDRKGHFHYDWIGNK